MLDKYGAGHDPYCYSDSPVLVNRLGIKDSDELENAERQLSRIAAAKIQFQLPPYDFAYLCRIHTILFEAVYEWAGELRMIDISKGQTRFCHVPHIEREANRLFKQLADEAYLAGLDYEPFISRLAEYYCELNMVHPFREGNGRAQRVLFEHVAIHAGYPIDYSSISATEWVEANIAGVHCDYTKMRRLLGLCIG